LFQVFEQVAVGGVDVRDQDSLGFTLQPLSRLRRYRIGDLSERPQDWAIGRIFGDQVAHLLRHVSQRDSRRSNPGRQPLVEQHECLFDENGYRTQTREPIFVIADRVCGHRRHQLRNFLVDASELVDGQIF